MEGSRPPLLADPSVEQATSVSDAKGAPSGGGGALLRIHSGAALEGELCGVGPSLDCFWHSFDGQSFNNHLFHTPKPHSLRFLERERTGLGLSKFTIRIRNHHITDHSCRRERISHNRNRRRHTHAHLTPVLTLIPREIHHSLLPILTRARLIACAFTNHSHSFRMSLRLPLPTFALFIFGFPLSFLLRRFNFNLPAPSCRGSFELAKCTWSDGGSRELYQLGLRAQTTKERLRVQKLWRGAQDIRDGPSRQCLAGNRPRGRGCFDFNAVISACLNLPSKNRQTGQLAQVLVEARRNCVPPSPGHPPPADRESLRLGQKCATLRKECGNGGKGRAGPQSARLSRTEPRRRGWEPLPQDSARAFLLVSLLNAHWMTISAQGDAWGLRQQRASRTPAGTWLCARSTVRSLNHPRTLTKKPRTFGNSTASSKRSCSIFVKNGSPGGQAQKSQFG